MVHGERLRRLNSLHKNSTDYPALLRSGSAALVWWKAVGLAVRWGMLKEFFVAYKLQTLHAAIHELNVKKVFRTLRAAGVDAMLVKGWAIARRYPKPALRPYGDLDIAVRPEQYNLAKDVLRKSGVKNVWVDLHRGFDGLDDEDGDTLFERALAVRARGFALRVPSEEDHLRMLCLHLLRHGASRPVWLCDIARALETRSENFDWEVFYGHDAKHEQWLSCVIGLTEELLHAQIDDGREVERSKHVPRWLVKAVERRWSRWFNSDYREHAVTSLLSHRFEPARALEDFYFRFDPLRATVEVNGAFSRMPRLPYQLAALVRRLPEVPAHLTTFAARALGH